MHYFILLLQLALIFLSCLKCSCLKQGSGFSGSSGGIATSPTLLVTQKVPAPKKKLKRNHRKAFECTMCFLYMCSFIRKVHDNLMA